jgi:hypothetical protein
MSKIEVNAIEPQCGTTLTVGASGDTIVIPSGATISNQGTAAGFGPTGAVSWNTTKITADPNPAVTGVGYFADTTSAAFTITLPSSPAAGAVVGIADYANTFATNNLTVGRNGSNIGGVANNGILSTNGLSVTFVYVDATQGWIVTDSGNRSDLPTPAYIVATGGTITCDGDYKIHTFTGPGTFTVCSVGNPSGSDTVEYLTVAGGGGGGKSHAGGGGAGGFRQNYPSPAIGGLPVTATSYPITVGSGGAGNISGNNSIFSTITSTGGGGGGGEDSPLGRQGLSGGSGGGGGSYPQPGGTGGAGNTPPVSPPQGSAGGNGTIRATAGGGGGGGGASAAGSTQPNSPGYNGGPGGNGTATSISGTSITYAGGGGGGAWAENGGTGGSGGSGGGGNGGGPGAATSGTTNRGGGGGGGRSDNGVGGAGGSGIVVIRYKFQ